MGEKIVLKHMIGGFDLPVDDPKRCIKLLATLKDSKYFPQFREKNILLTKEKVKKSVKDDIFIVQCINSIDEMNKAVNMHTKRLREWAAYPFPELSEENPDNELFVEKVITFVSPKEQDMMSISLEGKHLEQIRSYASTVKSMIEQRKRQEEYLEKIMTEQCPNIAAVAGVQIGARLMSLVGGLEKFAFSPASKIQLLGAETALFRHLKTGARVPKHGIIHEHQLIASAKKEDKGKMARRLADKISMAAKIDYFKGSFAGDRLKEELK